jgi:hypothetical protein
MRLKHRDMVAAWVVALLLVVAVAVSPWDKLRANMPHGVVDVAQQRFSVDTTASGSADRLHHRESRFDTFGPEGP